MFRRLVMAAALLSGGCSAAPEDAPAAPSVQQSQAPPTWNLTSATLYLPPSLTDQRITSEALADYLLRVKDAAAASFGREARAPGVSGSIIVMIKPGQRSRFWIVTGNPLDDTVSTRVLSELQPISPPSVEGGPVVVGLNFDGWGGGTQPSNMPYPVPDSWRALMPPGGTKIDDAFLAKVWPD